MLQRAPTITIMGLTMRLNRSTIAQCIRSQDGAVAVIFALALTALIGFSALGVEVGLWYMEKARLQEVADTAAMAADRELAAGTGKISAAATLASQMNNCTGATNCSIDPPTTFRTASSPSVDNGVQVVARTTVTPLFAGLFVQTNANGTLPITATGKAAYTIQSSGGVTGCVLALDSHAAYTLWLKNNASTTCSVMSNSNCQGPNSATCTLDATTYGSYSCSHSVDPQCGASISESSMSSLYLSNNATITGTGTAAGKIYLANNASITTKVPNATRVDDPYAGVSLSVPSSTSNAIVAGGNGSSSGQAIDISIGSGSCSTNPIVYSNNIYVNIHPGCYNGWNLKNNVVVTLYPGTYIIKSQFSVSNNARVTGTSGTTLVFSGDYAIDIGNNAILSMVAPTTGTYAGIALMGDPNGVATVVQTFSNNATLNIKGAIYFRRQILNLENNAVGGGSNGCTQLIARRVLLSNNAGIGLNCAGVGTSDISIGQAVTKIVDIVE